MRFSRLGGCFARNFYTYILHYFLAFLQLCGALQFSVAVRGMLIIPVVISRDTQHQHVNTAHNFKFTFFITAPLAVNSWIKLCFFY